MRAAPLAPEARRASIIAATIPLLKHHGRAVTTAQIAMAAGVAEGTLFRVFPDKDSLIAAAIETAFDPAPVLRALAGIEPHGALRDRLVAAVEILQRRVEEIWQLMAMLGIPPPTGVHRTAHERCAPAEEAGDPTTATLAALFESHRDELRCDPAQAARLLRAMTFAGTHPRIMAGAPLTAGEIVGVLLDGIRRRAEGPGEDSEAAC